MCVKINSLKSQLNYCLKIFQNDSKIVNCIKKLEKLKLESSDKVPFHTPTPPKPVPLPSPAPLPSPTPTPLNILEKTRILVNENSHSENDITTLHNYWTILNNYNMEQSYNYMSYMRYNIKDIYEILRQYLADNTKIKNKNEIVSTEL